MHANDQTSNSNSHNLKSWSTPVLIKLDKNVDQVELSLNTNLDGIVSDDS